MGDRLSRSTERPEAAAAPVTVAKTTRFLIIRMAKFDLVSAVLVELEKCPECVQRVLKGMKEK